MYSKLIRLLKTRYKIFLFKNNGSILINQNIKNIFKKISKLLRRSDFKLVDMDGTEMVLILKY